MQVLLYKVRLQCGRERGEGGCKAFGVRDARQKAMDRTERREQMTKFGGGPDMLLYRAVVVATIISILLSEG